MEGVAAVLIVKFEKTGEGVESMIVTIDNGPSIKSLAYEPLPYGVNDYKKYEGSYYSKELNVNYDLMITKDQLILYVNGKEISSIKAVKENTLSNDDFGVFEFFGSTADSIEGFKLMAGRVRNLKFTKN